jgi:hypothetical protein
MGLLNLIFAYWIIRYLVGTMLDEQKDRAERERLMAYYSRGFNDGVKFVYSRKWTIKAVGQTLE